MDKYQEYLFRSLRISTTLAAKKPKPNTYQCYLYDNTAGAKDFIFNAGKILITQNDNYHLHEYELVVTHPKLDEIWVIKNGNKILGEVINDTSKKLAIDFDSKSTSLFVSFKDNLADPINIPIEYKDADKSAWDAKMENEHKEHLANIVNIKINKGDSLINVLYNPLNDEYSYCEITLYYAYTKQGENTKSYKLMGTFKSEKGKFYISITNLGYGSYAIELKQYDELGKPIYESEKIEFNLSKPSKVAYNRKMSVHI